MKQTRWDIEDDITRLVYHHCNGEIYLEQQLGRTSKEVEQVGLTRDELVALQQAIGELLVILDAEKIESITGNAA